MNSFQDLVLSDDLFKLYYAVKQSCLGEPPIVDLSSIELEKIHQLFSFYKPHLTNIRQMKEVLGEDNISAELESSFAKSEISQTASLEELAECTRYKIILDENRDDFPYVKINGVDNPRLLYSGVFKKSEKREKGICHLKALCKDADGLTIYDKYLAKEKNEVECQNLLNKIVSLMTLDRQINLIVVCWCQNRSDYSTIKNSSEWKLMDKCLKQIKKDQPNLKYMIVDSLCSEYKDCHDRYMKIISKKTGNVEVLLSSGFDNFFDSQKDCTYVVRPI